MSQQKLQLRAPYLFPKIGKKRVTYFEKGGLELYTQTDTGRYEATMEAVKWLSDNSFLWTTVGRGASPAEVDPGPARLQDRRAIPGTCAAPSSTAWRSRRVGEIPVLAGPDFTIYSRRQFPGQDAGRRLGRARATPEDAMEQIQEQWQKGLDAG